MREEFLRSVDFGAVAQAGHGVVYADLGRASCEVVRVKARVDVFKHMCTLVNNPDLAIFDKAVRNGRKATGLIASFFHDASVTFRIKVLTGHLPTCGQLHKY